MNKDQSNASPDSNKKVGQLDAYRTNNKGKAMTTNQGAKVSEDEHSLKAGVRGPTIMEDFHFREKMTHFDHERIPERIVHARGYAAHGVFELYESLEEYTSAKFLQDTSRRTPVFVRFSTVAGSRGSADTVRDVRGFATKFYTDEGNYDLVGNNIPVFFIQDAIKFPDLVHSFKPEPHNEMPQASTAHDTFWDFVANNQETAHMIMWAMSDRAIPRSYRMMEGFGVHTFRFVNDAGKAHFVKFHWKPVLGVHSLVWDEAQKLAGKDPDYHRRDLWEAIQMGDYPEYELGVQLIAEEDEFKFGFDVLDPTKIWPEEMVPVKIVGKMTLNRNVDNVFAETEQVAFHPGHVVPGIDFTNDPLLQGRLFSYTDTQLSRLGGPNFHQLPINQPVCPFHNNQRDAMHQMQIHKGQVSYHKNSIDDNTPNPVSGDEGGYVHYTEKVEGKKVRKRSDSFADHFSQAILFWHSMSDVEKSHIIQAFSFELGKVKSKDIQQQVVDMFSQVDSKMAQKVANAIGANPPKTAASTGGANSQASPALSQMNTAKTALTRKVAILIEDGYNFDNVNEAVKIWSDNGIHVEIISSRKGMIKSSDGRDIEADQTFLTVDSVLYDAVYVPGGQSNADALSASKDAKYFIMEAYGHYKTIGATAEAKKVLTAAIMIPNLDQEAGVLVKQGNQTIQNFADGFMLEVAKHRHWNRRV
ncbi:MAG: catalase [Bacillus sp. (in: firmicutes)]